MNDWLRCRLGIASNRNPWRYMLAVAANKAKRPLCLVRRHRHWARETMLTALASGRSKRCGACNRLVLKAQYRQAGAP